MTVDRHAAANCQNLVESVVEQPTAGHDGDLLRWLSTDLIHRQVEQMNYCEEEVVRWATHLLYSVVVV